MAKVSNKRTDQTMSKFVCNSVNASSKSALQKSVEKIIKQNQKVFDNLAKS